ncbi:DUF2914 domain-containing protein [Patescibacteria group bacterium]|nr:DUF2914 domain-containing protein [Patescibacteria group bacterium]
MFQTLYEHGLSLWNRWERRLAAVALLVGFVFDLIIADRPDSVQNNLLLLLYLIVAGGCIIALNLRVRRQAGTESVASPLFLLVVLQFCFGGLASNLFVLYGRSGTLVGSALFIALLGAMLVGNEFLRSRYETLRFNIGVYYILLLTYLIIAVPTFILHSIGVWVFVASGVFSLILIAGFLYLIYFTVLRGRARDRQFIEVSAVVVGIFIFFNTLYFFNIIPPVPLSLKAVGVYHSISRSGSDYTATYENPAWFAFWHDTSGTFTLDSSALLKSNPTAYCFSSIFAPTGLKTPVIHVWEQYNEAASAWQERSRVSFAISGGRTGGYRGFSLKSSITPGRWRCNVETRSGVLIGRISFTVTQSQMPPTLSTKTL